MTAEEHREYVAGFLFHRKQVLLVRKTHPKWQENMMNGIGGEIEKGECALDAMVREFDEEAGMHLQTWEGFAVERGPGYVVHFFRCTLSDTIDASVSKYNDRGEELEWCNPHDIRYPVIGNLHWLLPLALDPRPIKCVVGTTGDIRKLVTW